MGWPREKSVKGTFFKIKYTDEISRKSFKNNLIEVVCYFLRALKLIISIRPERDNSYHFFPVN